MHLDFSTIQPFLIAALVVWVIYRRVRRNFGRQLLRPRRMMVRIALLAVIGCLLAPLAARSSAMLAAVAGGLVAGVALGLWGAERTRFLDQDGQRYFLPHTYTGLAVTLLVLGRFAFRMTQVVGGPHAAAGVAGGRPGGFSDALVRTPLSVTVLFVLIGYYVCFYARVLQKSKHPTPADLEPTDAGMGPSPGESPPP